MQEVDFYMPIDTHLRILNQSAKYVFQNVK